MNYVLPIIGAYLVINGIVVGSQAPTIMQQIAGLLYAGFGLLVIGIGALIGTVKIGFARLEKRLTPAPGAATMASPPASEKSLGERLSAVPTLTPEQKESYWNRIESIRPWKAGSNGRT